MAHETGAFLNAAISAAESGEGLGAAVGRALADSGKGYRLTGHHEIMFPLLCAALLENLWA